MDCVNVGQLFIDCDGVIGVVVLFRDEVGDFCFYVNCVYCFDFVVGCWCYLFGCLVVVFVVIIDLDCCWGFVGFVFFWIVYCF